MAQIITRLFNYLPDNYLLLGGEEWVRPMGWLGDWQRIRLGMLIAIRPCGTANLQNATLNLGLVSSRANTMSGFTTDNALGYCFSSAAALGTARNWTYAANTGYPTYAPTGTGQIYHKYTNPTSGQVLVTTNLSSSTFTVPHAGIGYRKRRIPFVLDILRNPSSGLCTFTIYYPNLPTQDWACDRLIDAVSQSSANIIIDGDTWTTTNATLYATDLTGALDSFSIYWSNAFYPLELYAACACLMSDSNLPQASYPSTGGAYDIFTPAGTNVVAVGLNTGRGWGGSYSFYGTDNSTLPQLGFAGTSAGAYDSFSQYSAGTIYSGTLNAGTNWAGAYTVGGTYGNIYVQTGTAWYGTVQGADDPFQQYSTGTVLTGVLNAGTNWSGPFIIAGTYPNSTAIFGTSFYGTITGADESFSQYPAGTVFTNTLNSGTNWSGPLLISGTYSNLFVQTGGAWYGTINGADDPFSQYSTGTVLTGALNAGTNWLGAYTVGGTYSNSGPLPGTAYYGTVLGADDPFSQYSTGTVLTGALNAGTNWLGAYTVGGTYPNLTPFAGTAWYGNTVGIDDPFSQYAAGTVFTGALNAGTNWLGAYTVGGTYPNLGTISGTEFYGTALGNYERFDQYATGSIASMAYGSNWNAPFFALFYAGTTYSNDYAQVGLGGTSVGSPWDGFEQYALGTVTGPLNQGTGWSSYGTITAY